MDKTQADVRAEMTAGLRDLADWLDNHPELPLPSQATGTVPARLSIGIQAWDSENRREYEQPVVERFAAATRALGGSRTKDASEEFLYVQRQFGPAVVLDLWSARDEVCEAVVVGTERVEVQQIITPAVTETVVEEREVIEWRCAPILGVAS